MTNLARMGVDAGRDLIQGLLRGISNLASSIGNKLMDIVSDAWDSVLGFFGISSPAKEGIWAMEMLGRGLEIGLERARGGVAAGAQSLMDAAAIAIDGSITMAIGQGAIEAANIPPGIEGGAATLGTASAAAMGTQTTNSSTIRIDNLTLQVPGVLDQSDPTKFRQTIIAIKDAIREAERQYQ